MGKPSPATAKAFAIASTLGSIIESNNVGEPRLTSLRVQCNRAMRVFNVKAGPNLYWQISNKIKDIWVELGETHETKMQHDEIPLLIEYVAMMISPQNFKTFLGVSPYRTTNIDEIRPETIIKVSHMVLKLDEEFNEFFGTKAYTLNKPKVKVAKIKKKRDVSKKVKTKTTVSQSKLKKAKKKEEIRNFLREKIKIAREKKENEPTPNSQDK